MRDCGVPVRLIFDGDGFPFDQFADAAELVDILAITASSSWVVCLALGHRYRGRGAGTANAGGTTGSGQIRAASTEADLSNSLRV